MDEVERFFCCETELERQRLKEGPSVNSLKFTFLILFHQKLHVHDVFPSRSIEFKLIRTPSP